MKNTVLFGNGLNRVLKSSVSWNGLLDTIKSKPFDNGELPNTMVYERIFMEANNLNMTNGSRELLIKNKIASAMKKQEGNRLYEDLINLGIDNYLTTNYDYAFEKSTNTIPKLLSTEAIYSLRRKRSFRIEDREFNLWSIHGEVDHPKSIMLGLDHYCGSVSKLDAYIKGGYKYTRSGHTTYVNSMEKKLKDNTFCNIGWVDLFFSGNVHILGISLDYSEIDLWWILNKRARMMDTHNINNKIYFYIDQIEPEKEELLKSFNVEVIIEPVRKNDYIGMYKDIIKKISRCTGV